MYTLTRRALLAATIALAAVSTVPVTLAQGAESLTVKVALVHATRGDASVDAELSAFRRDLSSLPFTRFTHHGSDDVRVVVGTTKEIALGLDIRLRIQLERVDQDGATMTLDVLRGARTLAHTTVTRPLGSAHVMSAGAHEGGQLVVPVLTTE